MVLLVLLLSSVRSIDACIPTPSTPMPNPPTCSASCANGLLPVSIPPFASDTPSTSGSCAQRTLKCDVPPTGGSTAIITYNGSGMVSAPATVSLVVTCNGSGTAWTYIGIAITSVSCSYI